MSTETHKPETSSSPEPSQPSRTLSELHLWQIAAVRDAFWLGLGLAILLFTYYLRSIFTPVLIGLVLAYIFNPMISHLEHRWRVPRPATISVLLGFLVVMLVGIVAWVVPMLVNQTVALIRHTPAYVMDLVKYLEARHVVQPGGLAGVRTLTTMPQATPQDLMQTIYDWTGQAFGYVGTVIETGTYIALVMMLIPIYFFSFAWHFDAILQKVAQNIPPLHRPRVLEIAGQMDQAVSGFFRGRLTVAFIMCAVFMLGWWWAGVPYWFLLGILAAVLNIVPYLVVVALPLAVLLKWLDVTTGGAVVQAAATQPAEQAMVWVGIVVWPTVAYLVAQFLDNWFITPIIQSKSSNLSAVTIMIVVLVGGAVAGLYGLLLAIPVAACMKILAKEVLLPRMQEWAKET
jgi:predicted PurR-regulated permease PerM